MSDSRTKQIRNLSLGIPDYDFKFKIRVVGLEGTGKTSLIKRFYYNSFTEEYTKFMADFVEKTIESNGANVELQIWDTFGRENIREHRDQQYIGHHGYILVVDMTNPDSFNNFVPAWLNKTHKSEMEPLIMLVGTKSDLRQIMEPKDMEKFATTLNMAGCFITSAKTGEGVEEVFSSFTELLIEKIADVNQKSEFLLRNIKVCTDKKKEELVALIKQICTDEIYWENKVRCQAGFDGKFPDGVKQIRNIIQNGRQNYTQILNQIQVCADYKYSSPFMYWAHFLFRGRDTMTNQLYAILSKLHIMNIETISSVIHELNTTFTRYSNERTTLLIGSSK